MNQYLKFIIFAISFAYSTVALAQSTISIQSTLRNLTGEAAPDGNQTITFKLFNVATGGSPLWSETATVEVVSGFYSHDLGIVTPLQASVFDTDVYLSATINNKEFLPRLKLGYAPYVFKARSISSDQLRNTLTGTRALNSNTSGSDNTASGHEALYSNTTGKGNVAIGKSALYKNTTQSNLVAVGDSALFNNTIGSNNTAMGLKSLYSNTIGGGNTANGFQSLYSNTSGGGNTSIGQNALYSNTTGYENTAIGSSALRNNTTAKACIAIGNLALRENTTGENNTAVGLEALYSNTTGQNNTALGYNAGLYLETGNSNICIGSGSGPTSTDFGHITNSITIGSGTANNLNNQVIIGNASSSTIGGFKPWTNYSDGRMKKNVQANVPGLDFITKLRPVTYNRSVDDANRILGIDTKYDRSSSMYDVEKVRYTGLIAQEVEAAAQEIGYDFSGVKPAKHNNDLYSVSYTELIMPLIKAVQELNAENEKLKEKLLALENQNSLLLSEFAKIKTMLVENEPKN